MGIRKKKSKLIRYKAFQSAKTGKFVSKKYAKRHPATTMEVTIKYRRK